MIILKFNLEKKVGGVNLIYLAQGVDQWRALVSTVMNLEVP
jgi:hypothetical protein